jgi:hypothetical protein
MIDDGYCGASLPVFAQDPPSDLSGDAIELPLDCPRGKEGLINYEKK